MPKISPISLKNLGFEEETWTDENEPGSGVQDLMFSEFILKLDFAQIAHTYSYLNNELISERTQIKLNDEWTEIKECDFHKIKRLITKIKAIEDEVR